MHAFRPISDIPCYLSRAARSLALQAATLLKQVILSSLHQEYDVHSHPDQRRVRYHFRGRCAIPFFPTLAHSSDREDVPQAALPVASLQAVLQRQTQTCASSYLRRAPRLITTLRTGSPRATCPTLRRVHAPCVCMPAARAPRSETAQHSCRADSVLVAVGVSTVRLSLHASRGERGEIRKQND
jgi:hypothetical protein